MQSGDNYGRYGDPLVIDGNTCDFGIDKCSAYVMASQPPPSAFRVASKVPYPIEIAGRLFI
eukprot:SAG31_NODE_22843_length_517_cov_0.461722_1_plen_60_part_10